MKKVNFNALQNFEVSESWIENAINAKPKKKPFYLNPRYYGTAAALVIAVGIAAFSLLYLNRDFTPPTGQNVEGTSVSFTLSGQRLTEILSEGEMKTTEIQNETKQTEKPNATGVTEQNEAIYEQEINSEEQDNESSESENHTPVRAEESEQDEQSNNTKKPESIIKPQNPTAPIEQQQNTEQKQDSSNNKEEESELSFPEEGMEVDTGWYIKKNKKVIYGGNGQSEDDFDKGSTRIIASTDLFTNNIQLLVSEDIWKNECRTIKCTLNGTDNTTKGITGELIFLFNGEPREGVVINLKNEGIYIPCGSYTFNIECFSDEDCNEKICETTISKNLKVEKDLELNVYIQ